MTKAELISLLNNVTCSDGHCVFKLFKEQKQGMHTNGGCYCLHGLGNHIVQRTIRILLKELIDLKGGDDDIPKHTIK